MSDEEAVEEITKIMRKLENVDLTTNVKQTQHSNQIQINKAYISLENLKKKLSCRKANNE